MNKGNWNKRKPFLFLLIPIGIGLVVYAVMLLWNAILPDVIGVTEINYWQSLGILVLSKILFGGFGNGHHKSHKFKRPSKPGFMNMTSEEKESFKSEWKSRCKED